MQLRARRKASAEDQAVAACLDKRDQDGFKLLFINNCIGSGVFCDQSFANGDFLLEYRGELISSEEGAKREQRYERENKGNFLFFFHHEGLEKCIDATENDGYGRMVNDSPRAANCKMKLIMVEGSPRLGLFAVKDIKEGTELRYDYGVTSLPWRNKDYKQRLYHEPLFYTCHKGTPIDSQQQDLFDVQSKEKNGSSPNCHTQNCDDPVTPDEPDLFDVRSKEKNGSNSNCHTQNCDDPVTSDEPDLFDVRSKEKNGSSPNSHTQNCDDPVTSDEPDLFDVQSNEKHGSSPDCHNQNCNDPVTSDEPELCNLQSKEKNESNPSCHIQNCDDLRPVTNDSQDSSGSSDDDDDDKDPSYCPDKDQSFQTKKHCSVPKLCNFVSDSEDSEDCDSDSNEVIARLGSLRYLRKGKYKKPKRRCPFCSKYFSEKLSRHIGTVHRNLPQVAAALKLPKKEMDEVFSKMRKQGILLGNREQMKRRTPVLESERNTASNKSLVMCGLCKGFYAKKSFSRHKVRCQGDRCEEACTVPVSLLRSESTNQSKLLSEFSVNILCKFRSDEIGSICRNDPVILNIGKRLWDKGRAKENKKTEVRKSVMSDMRRLAALYVHYKRQRTLHGSPSTQEIGTSRDMFDRKNFNILSEAINAYTLNEEKDCIKSGLKIGVYYLLKKASKVIKATHFVEENDTAATEIDRFIAVLELNQNFIFGDASYQINMNRQKNLRRPASLPLEEDINKLRNYTVATLKSMVNDDFAIWDSHRFKKLRDLTVSRLTLFNARRGGEPSRLSMDEWRQASSNAWIDQQKADAIEDPIAKHLLNELKVTYQAGKGNNHLVPILFPIDCIKPMEMLACKETRNTASIRPNNFYIFACTQGSSNHVSGWHALQGVCEDAGIGSASNLTATKNRHRISTIYASLEIPEKERALFFKHMGHSADINENIYQAPAAIMEVVRVGKQLQQIDKAKPFSQDHVCTSDDSENSSENQPSHGRAYLSNDTEQNSDSQTEPTSSSELEEGEDFDQQESHQQKNDSKVTSARKYTKWTKKDTDQVKKYFHDMITGTHEKTIPGKHDVELFVKRSKLSKSYDWFTIRSKVMNERNKWNRLHVGL